VSAMDQSEVWDGRERRSPEDRRSGEDRRTDLETRKRLMRPADAVDDWAIPDGEWDRRSHQERRGHPFYNHRDPDVP
jgi:hypothetical protein